MKNILTIFVSIIVLLISTVVHAQWPLQTTGTLVVLNKGDNTATLFSLESGKTIATLPMGFEPHEGAISPDAKIAVVSNYGNGPNYTLTVIDILNKKVIKTISLGTYAAPHGIMFLPDGKRVIVTAEKNRAVIIVNIETGKIENAINTNPFACHMVILTPDGKKAFASSISGGTVVVLDLERGEMVKAIQTGRGAEGLDISPDAKEVWVGNRAEDTISIVDVDRLEVIDKLKSKGFPIRVKITPDGKNVLVSNAMTGEVAVFERISRKEIHRISTKLTESEARQGNLTTRADPFPIGILVTPDGRYAFVANTRANSVTVLDLIRWKVLTHLKTGNTPDGMIFSNLRVK